MVCFSTVLVNKSIKKQSIGFHSQFGRVWTHLLFNKAVISLLFLSRGRDCARNVVLLHVVPKYL